MSDQAKMTCLGECRKEHSELCAKSGKCRECCFNECGCTFHAVATPERYDNLCESAWLRSQPEVQ